ncbi:site-specific integrase [Marinobacter salarius]|uniref:site-specific integrase n=1 Tax=Marinobacter salarius TaxID=1420917 RepID=UPI0018F23108|nr:site-specific integrase [Marinobacter salarius]MBJ7276973.1 site-specific integrase [Marinobacter salarius]
MTIVCNECWKGWTDLLPKPKPNGSGSNTGEELGSFERATSRFKRRRREFGAIMSVLQQHYPQLYQGYENIRMADDEVTRLVDTVCDGASGEEFFDRQRLLQRGLTKGVKELGWVLAPPSPLMKERVEVPPLTPDTVKYWGNYESLLALLLDDTDFSETEEDLRQRLMAGQLVLSLVAHNFLLSTYWIAGIGPAIRRGVSYFEHLAWIDLRACDIDKSPRSPQKSEMPSETRRLFLAPPTQLLLYRFCRNFGGVWPDRHPSSLLEDYTNYAASDWPTEFRSFQGVLRSARTGACSRLPGFLRHYAESRSVAPSCSEHIWHRLVTNRIQQSTANFEPEEQIAPLDSLPEKLVKPPKLRDQISLYKQLLSALRSEDGTVLFSKTRAVERLNPFLQRSDMAPILRLLTEWCIWILENGSRWGNELKVSSVITYLSLIGPHLVSRSGDAEDPDAMEQEDWEEFYETCQVSASGRSDFGARLKDFHIFLMQSRGYPPATILDEGGETNVDVNFLSPIEFKRALALVDQTGDSQDWKDLRKVALILGYRLGLRRQEVLGRLVSDFRLINGQLVEVVVANNRIFRGKSNSATRKLPAELLLLGLECRLIERVLERWRLLNPGKTNRPLVSLTGISYWPALQKKIFDPITACLREVTGERGFRFHHLRHSFASLVAVRLTEMLPDSQLPSGWLKTEEGERLTPGESVYFWEEAGLVDPAQGIFLCAQWLGHASPQQTLTTYCHLMDWMLGDRLAWLWRVKGLGPSQQSQLTGKTPGAVERLRTRSGEQRAYSFYDGSQNLLRQFSTVNPKEAPEGEWLPRERLLKQKVNVDPSTTPWSYLLPYRLQLLAEQIKIRDSVGHAEAIQKAAALLDLPRSEAERWDYNAQFFMGLKGKDETRTDRQRRRLLSIDNELVRRKLDEKMLEKRSPELPFFISPPNTPVTRQAGAVWFEALIKWLDQEPVTALETIKMLLEAVRRNEGEIRVKGEMANVRFVECLKALGLKSTIDVKLRQVPESRKIECMRTWVRNLGIRKWQVKVVSEVSEAANSSGINLSVSVRPPRELNREQNLFWPTFRFALLSVAVIHFNGPWDVPEGLEWEGPVS